LRKPPNERPKLSLKLSPGKAPAKLEAVVEAAASKPAAPEPKSETERRCVLTGERVERSALVRLALGPDGEVLPDVRAKAPGRGAWIGVDRARLEQALVSGKLKGALGRAFRTRDLAIPADLPERVEQQLERAALDRLGLEARAGTIVTGSERIEAALRSGKAELLLHASDAGADGTRKLDQALRVGQDAEGSSRRGLVIAAPRTILSLALGRENVVHVAVTDRGAARRVGEALARWHSFIGFDLGEQPCETASQGSSAAATSSDEAAAATNEGFSTVHE
jgi:uncharacterized protein